MKKMIRLIALMAMLALAMGLFTACGGSKYAIKVGNSVVSENDYKRGAATLRRNYLAGSGEEDSEALWLEKGEDGSNLSDVFVASLQEELIAKKLYVEQFERLELSLSAEEEQIINEALQQVVESYGSMTAFNEALGKGYYTYDEFTGEYYDSAKKTKVLKYYFGEGGDKPVSLQDLKDYFQVHHAYIKFIYISKLDAEEKPLTGDALAAARKKAEEALAAAKRVKSEKDFESLSEIHSSLDFSASEGMLVSDDGSYNEEITEKTLKMEIGEIQMIEGDEAFMIIRRCDGTVEEVFTADLQQAMLEEIRAEEIEELLAAWREEFGVKINKRVCKKYRPEKFVSEE